MGAARVTVEVAMGLDELYCPKCGALIFDEEMSWDESSCLHVRFVEDWAGELWVAPPERVPLGQRPYLRGLERCDFAEVSEAVHGLATRLPPSYLLLTVAEPGRLSGTRGASVTVGLDLAPVGG